MHYLSTILLIIIFPLGFGIQRSSDEISIEKLSSDIKVSENEEDPIAHGKFKFLGNVYSSSQIPGFENYWNQVTPENAGKWGSVERNRDVMDWEVLDNAYNYAKDNGFYFKFHVLIWGNQQPSWIENLSSAEQLEEIEEWFAAVAERYPEIDAIEVVNEPINDPPNSTGNGGGNYINALGGTGSTGYDWVINAFKMAREHFPNAKLMINEYSIINDSNKLNKYKHLIGFLKDQELIDQVGFQAHAFNTTGSVTTMESNLDKLAELELPLFVTEMDIDGPSDEVQLKKYKEVFPLFWEHSSVKGITLWGYRPGMWRTSQKAYLIEDDGVTERPAMIWLRDYVQNTVLSLQNPTVQKEISIYPNPLKDGILSIKSEEIIKKIEIYNMNAALIKISYPFSSNVKLNIADLTSGQYILKCFAKDKVENHKVILQ